MVSKPLLRCLHYRCPDFLRLQRPEMASSAVSKLTIAGTTQPNPCYPPPPLPTSPLSLPPNCALCTRLFPSCQDEPFALFVETNQNPRFAGQLSSLALTVPQDTLSPFHPFCPRLPRLPFYHRRHSSISHRCPLLFACPVILPKPAIHTAPQVPLVSSVVASQSQRFALSRRRSLGGASRCPEERPFGSPVA